MLSMHAGALQALEFDRIVAAVERMAQTPPGAERLSRLAPQMERASVASALAATAETARFLSGTGEIALRAPAELPDIFEGLGVEGRALEPLQLLGLATYLESINATVAGIRRASASFSILARTVAGASSFEPETTDIRRKIDPAGEVADDASPELRSIRDRLRKQRSRLRGTLESYIRGKDTAKYLQQQIVTDRNGRYVLVVRSEHRAAIPGIVHGSSASGASLFLEPLSTVEINNDIVALEQQEAEEVRRILLEVTDRFRRRSPELDATTEAATALDVLQAKARYSLGVDGIEPKLAADGRLELRGARHPLLIAQRIEVVAVDIVVMPPTRVLVITGPNTGGKTVALKTAGLLPLMAQAGLLIPAAAGSQIPVFTTVFADIGDEQSIADNLSTFSGHISNIVGMDRALALPGLVLLDEAGSGTDPNEGGALAMAIIDHFRRRGAMVVATTHFDALKTYASTTEGVTSAGFGFDPRTFAPTYRLNYGSPGSSLALEIASRLGLPPSIIEQARGVRGERETQLADHLAKIERELQELEHHKRLVAREQQTVRDTQARLQAREQELKDREETFRRRLDQRIDERMREARREIDAVVEGLKVRASTIASNADRNAARLVPTGEIGSARADARSALEGVGTKLRQEISSPLPSPASGASSGPSRPATTGDRVAIGPLGIEGIVQSTHDGNAEVDVRGKRMRAKLRDLRVLSGAPSQPAKAQVRVNVDMAPRTASLTEINVIGSTSDDAVTKVERFIDDAMMSDVKSVRIIHGYGTGQLRRSIGAFLKGHPYVAHFGPAPDNQGGGGVTIADLKE